MDRAGRNSAHRARTQATSTPLGSHASGGTPIGTYPDGDAILKILPQAFSLQYVRGGEVLSEFSCRRRRKVIALLIALEGAYPRPIAYADLCLCIRGDLSLCRDSHAQALYLRPLVSYISNTAFSALGVPVVVESVALGRTDAYVFLPNGVQVEVVRAPLSEPEAWALREAKRLYWKGEYQDLIGTLETAVLGTGGDHGLADSWSKAAQSRVAAFIILGYLALEAKGRAGAMPRHHDYYHEELQELWAVFCRSLLPWSERAEFASEFARWIGVGATRAM